MNIRKKLTNPFALVAQGFGLGAVLFLATVPADQDAPQSQRPSQSAVLPENLGA